MLPEDMHDALATQADAAREFISNTADPDGPEWLLSPYDSWHRNPAYQGQPGPHPEDDWYGEYVPTYPSQAAIDAEGREPYIPVPAMEAIVFDPNTPF